MKRAKKGCLLAMLATVLISLFLYIPIWIDDSDARQNRARVHELIEVGQNLSAAQRILRDGGFQLTYDEPIAPTIRKDYLHQLVIVGETRPNLFETIGYAADLPWMPFTHSESPYVIIEADLDGNITGTH